jgi:hypothetical protein
MAPGRREVPGALSAGVGLCRRSRRFAIASVALLAVLVGGCAALGAERSDDRVAGARTHFDRPETGEPGAQPPPVASATAGSAAVSRDLAASRSSAREFLTGYLALLHGRGSIQALVHVAPALRRELRRTRPRVTPTQQQTRSEILQLSAALRSPGSVRALATVRARGGPPYPLQLYLERRGSRWVVTRIGDA